MKKNVVKIVLSVILIILCVLLYEKLNDNTIVEIALL